jgi:hypothetical protein
MDRAEYDRRMGELEERGKEKLRQGNARLLELAKRAAFDEVVFALVLERITHGAATDTARLILQGVVFDEMLRPTIDGRVVNLTTAAKSFLTERPWLRQRASTTTPTNKVASDKAADAGKGVWDIQRAVKDLKYNDEWEKADPEGHKAAWDAHIANKDEELRRRKW